VFADKFCSYEAFSALADVDPRIPMKWIVPPAGPRFVSCNHLVLH
jgi:hypothetical protein